MKIKFTSFPDGSNWVKGTVNDGEFSFESKLFDEGSLYGINEGRISKLTIWKGKDFLWDGTVINYDRGWDIEPGEECQELFNEVVSFLENSPKRFTE
jgi:hypothetical protein